MKKLIIFTTFLLNLVPNYDVIESSLKFGSVIYAGEESTGGEEGVCQCCKRTGCDPSSDCCRQPGIGIPGSTFAVLKSDCKTPCNGNCCCGVSTCTRFPSDINDPHCKSSSQSCTCCGESTNGCTESYCMTKSKSVYECINTCECCAGINTCDVDGKYCNAKNTTWGLCDKTCSCCGLSNTGCSSYYCEINGKTIIDCSYELCPCCFGICSGGYCSLSKQPKSLCSSPQTCSCCGLAGCLTPNRCVYCSPIPPPKTYCKCCKTYTCLTPNNCFLCKDLPPDCNGTPGGFAYYDDCKICVGGTTNRFPCNLCPGEKCLRCLRLKISNENPDCLVCECPPITCNGEKCKKCGKLVEWNHIIECDVCDCGCPCCGGSECMVDVCFTFGKEIINKTCDICQCCGNPDCPGCCLPCETPINSSQLKSLNQTDPKKKCIPECCKGEENCTKDHCAEITKCPKPDCNKIVVAIKGCDCGVVCPRHPCETSVDSLKKAFPNADTATLRKLKDLLDLYAFDYGIDSKDKLQHFLAQAGHETGSFSKLGKEEDLWYTDTARLIKVFPSKFSHTDTITKRKPNGYIKNEQKLANYVYAGGDLGNGDEDSGEGYKYRGRGIFQLTGKDNYKRFTDFYNKKYNPDIDLKNNPDLVKSNDTIAVLSALWYYYTRVIAKITINDKTSVDAVTKKINKKKEGLPDRKKKYKSVKKYIDCENY